jgi:excisionase family DNA binding protein
MKALNAGQVLIASEVAALFGVDPKTVTRWAKAGKIECFWTPGGHRRYDRQVVEETLNRKPVK